MNATQISARPTRWPRAAAAAAAAAILCATALVWPYAKIQGAVVPAFIPIFATSVALMEGLTAFLLWTQYRAAGQPDFAVLASAYAFTSVAAALHLAVYPGVFRGAGLFGAGRQTAIWIWLAWRGGFPLLVLLALATRTQPSVEHRTQRRSRGLLAIGSAIGLSIALCAAAIAARDLLPNLVSSDGGYRHLAASPATLSVAAIGLAALGVHAFATRLRTPLDLWLAVALLAGLVDVTLTLGAGARYSVGWYAARIASMVSASALLGMLMYETSRAYARLTDAHRMLKELSVRDGLTGVFNRAYFDARYPRELARAMESLDPLCILLVDVDHFKAYNDAFGHLAGDECLRRIAHTLDAASADQRGFVARYGGEEFVVVLPGADPRSGLAAAERLRRSVEEIKLPAPAPGAPYVTISIGHASSRSRTGLQPETLLARADAALYEAKAHGRNRVEDEKSDEDDGAKANPRPRCTAPAYPATSPYSPSASRR